MPHGITEIGSTDCWEIVQVSADTDDIHSLIQNSQKEGHFWRFLALVQIPVVAISMLAFITLYFKSDPVLNTPEDLPPGSYQASQLPDKEFINIAQDFVNLIGTFQPHTAREQFESAKMLITEDLDPRFDNLLVDMELATAEESFVSQILILDPALTTVERRGSDTVEVCLSGFRQRIVQGTVLPQQDLLACLIMATGDPIPESKYGILITDFSFEFGRLQTGVKAEKRQQVIEEPTKKRGKPRARARKKNNPKR